MILPEFAGIPIDFILFAITLLGVALLHNQTLVVALAGVATISVYKIIITGFSEGSGLTGRIADLGHEWVTLANLFCLLIGFALLSRHFEKSHLPVILPKYLPDDWKGGLVLLATLGGHPDMHISGATGRKQNIGVSPAPTGDAMTVPKLITPADNSAPGHQ